MTTRHHPGPAAFAPFRTDISKGIPVASNSLLKRLTQIERLNFLLTNRIPRRYATLFMGWFSKLKNPLVRRLSIGLWRLFADDLNLAESKKAEFSSLHDCFIRELKPGARQIDKAAEVVISPCDAIVGAFGNIHGTELFQAKGFPYSLMDLLGDEALVERYRDGIYVTLRLKSTMYHRFHAPCACRITQVNYIAGDTWNVNPIALKRVEQLYCKNERAIIDLQLANPACHLTLVPVAAILVAGIKLHCLPEVLDLRYRGPNLLSCNAEYAKGDELGYFQHGSTIIVFANNQLSLADSLQEGMTIRMGQSLMHDN
jgi:phosphatidylserine decarboxylase